MISIKALPETPEKYAAEIYAKLPEAAKSESLMLSDINRRFISGLIRLCKPKNILEIGVAYGGGTCVILNAISDCPETKLVSIDRFSVIESMDLDPKKKTTKKTGYVATELYLEAYKSGKAKLITGVDPSEIMESFVEKFDFVVLDTMHIHPIETLNFISVYPFITDDAVVVLDDIMLQFQNPRLCATRLLLNSITADKYTPGDMNIISQNVAAFQLNADTPKYIDDVFNALYMNWYMYTEDIFSVRKTVEKYYSQEQLKIFDSATEYNEKCLAQIGIKGPHPTSQRFLDMMYEQAQDFALLQSAEKVRNNLKPFEGNNIYFYCAGVCARLAVEYLEKAGLSEFLPKGIFDQNFENKEPINGIPVIKPDFSKLNDNDIIVVTLLSETEAEKLVKIIQAVGFANIRTVHSLGLPLNFI